MAATQDQPISVGNLAAALDSIVASVIASDQLTAKVEQVVADVTGGQTYWVGSIECWGGSDCGCTIDVERSQGIGFIPAASGTWYGAKCTLQPGTYRITYTGTAKVFFLPSITDIIQSGYDGTINLTDASELYVQAVNSSTRNAALTIIKLT